MATKEEKPLQVDFYKTYKVSDHTLEELRLLACAVFLEKNCPTPELADLCHMGGVLIRNINITWDQETYKREYDRMYKCSWLQEGCQEVDQFVKRHMSEYSRKTYFGE